MPPTTAPTRTSTASSARSSTRPTTTLRIALRGLGCAAGGAGGLVGLDGSLGQEHVDVAAARADGAVRLAVGVEEAEERRRQVEVLLPEDVVAADDAPQGAPLHRHRPDLARHADPFLQVLSGIGGAFSARVPSRSYSAITCAPSSSSVAASSRLSRTTIAVVSDP